MPNEPPYKAADSTLPRAHAPHMSRQARFEGDLLAAGGRRAPE
jgi:hypothetical protein